ncbi:MAG: hypothetical protein J5637_00745 [Prevotella sp.]|nr:hypothetical protein [Prevotella sp.]
MKKNVFYAVMMAMVVMMTACSSNDDDYEPVQPTLKKSESITVAQAKTVLVYMAGRNDLSDMANDDLREMVQGSKLLGAHDNLLVFVRRDKTEKLPWLARIKNGMVTDSVSLSDMGITSSDGENRASDPVVMENVMRYAFSHYPAMEGNYGLVLWGHGSGWLMKDEVKCAPRRAYGVDYGENSNGLWMNITTMANILKGMPHLKFIMADCCNFMCLEVLYELRNVCDYIIGSPAEIPGSGAPYDQIVPDMFADGRFYTSIIDKYYQSMYGYLPLTAVQTNQMEQLAQATRHAMQAVQTTISGNYADMTGLIHYYHTDKRRDFHPEYNIFYDAGDFFLSHAPQDVYLQWKQALDKAIVEHRNATCWSTDKPWCMKYSDFTVTDQKMHGVSMFVEQNPAKGNYAKYNEDIKKMDWWKVMN